jgi:hypothetical protein
MRIQNASLDGLDAPAFQVGFQRLLSRRIDLVPMRGDQPDRPLLAAQFFGLDGPTALAFWIFHGASISDANTCCNAVVCVIQ